MTEHFRDTWNDTGSAWLTELVDWSPLSADTLARGNPMWGPKKGWPQSGKAGLNSSCKLSALHLVSHPQRCKVYLSVHGRPSSFVQKMVVRTHGQYACQISCGPHRYLYIGRDSNCAAYGQSECVRTMLEHRNTVDVLQQWWCVQTQWMGLM